MHAHVHTTYTHKHTHTHTHCMQITLLEPEEAHGSNFRSELVHAISELLGQSARMRSHGHLGQTAPRRDDDGSALRIGGYGVVDVCYRFSLLSRHLTLNIHHLNHHARAHTHTHARARTHTIHYSYHYRRQINNTRTESLPPQTCAHTHDHTVTLALTCTTANDCDHLC